MVQAATDIFTRIVMMVVCDGGMRVCNNRVIMLIFIFFRTNFKLKKSNRLFANHMYTLIISRRSSVDLTPLQLELICTDKLTDLGVISKTRRFVEILFSISVTGFVWESYGQGSREYLVWYVLFIVFVTYAMLPLPLRWCILAGCSTALLHILITSYTKSSKEKVTITLRYKTVLGAAENARFVLIIVYTLSPCRTRCASLASWLRWVCCTPPLTLPGCTQSSSRTEVNEKRFWKLTGPQKHGSRPKRRTNSKKNSYSQVYDLMCYICRGHI